MGKKKSGGSGSGKSAQQRERWNYIEKKMEVVPGTKAGKKRTRLPVGHPLRTHDLHGPAGKKKSD
ncbi:MAG: hypothetical protein EBT27_00055 [Betaproteobacteria bacterium]|nr:hypothetical protein [Betaproteobacteria bacterium]